MLTRLLLSSAFLAASLFNTVSGGLIPSVGTIQNPGFEDYQMVGNIAVPTHWEQSGSGDATHPTVRTNSTEKHTGLYSAQFTPNSITNIVTGNTIYVAEIWQQVSLVEAGQLLTLSYWVKFGGVPEGVDSSPIGRYNFSVSYDHDHDSMMLNPTYVTGSSNQAGNFFYKYQVSWNAPNNVNHHDAYLTLSFTAYDSNVYIFLDDISLTAPLVTGDPQFVGLRGQSYQVHGIDGGIYNLVSSPSTQVNAEFKFLSEGECPIFDGIPDTNCWAHPGSYLGAIGIQQVVDGKTHQLTITAGSAKNGFASIMLDDQEVSVGSSFEDTEAFTVERVSSHQVLVKTAEFSFIFDNSDMFINQAVSPRVALSGLKAHGLFGQTHHRKVYPSALKYIEGEVDDYLVEENTLFGKDFVYNQFQN